MDKDRLAFEVYNSVPDGSRIPSMAVTIDGTLYASTLCGCEAEVIEGVDFEGQPTEFLGWSGCEIHQYDENGDLKIVSRS